MGGAFSLALLCEPGEQGTVWAWGSNSNGQMGNGVPGSVQRNPTPVQVVGLVGVVAIAAGDAHNLALRPDHTVWAWGWNGDGQLGDGTTGVSRALPQQIAGLRGITVIGTGRYHSLAVATP